MTLCKPRPLPRHPTKPRRLEPGDTIALVAPASPPLSPDVIDRAAQLFSERGFKVHIGASARQQHGFLAGSDRERQKDLNRAIVSKAVRAIVNIRGGYGCGRILDGVNFKALTKDPKIIVGCSDITALHCAVAIEAGVVTFHGPMPQSLVDPACPEFTWNHLLATLTQAEGVQGPIAYGYIERNSTVVCIRKGRATGRLIGGNLSVLCSLIGTRYLPSLRGAILFFEDVAEAPYRIDRMLTQLLSIGALHQVAGFALGLFKDCEYPPSTTYRQSLAEVVHERLGPLGKPILMGLPFGHVPFNATIPVGIKASLDATRGELFIEEKALA